MLRAIHAQEEKESALQKAQALAAKVEGMHLHKAVGLANAGISETLTYMAFPREH